MHERIDGSQLPELREFDLINGLTGIGVYLLHTDNIALLREVLSYLVRLAEPVALLSTAIRFGVTVPGQADAIDHLDTWLDDWRCGTPSRPWWPGMISMCRRRHTTRPAPRRLAVPRLGRTCPHHLAGAAGITLTQYTIATTGTSGDAGEQTAAGWDACLLITSSAPQQSHGEGVG